LYSPLVLVTGDWIGAQPAITKKNTRRITAVKIRGLDIFCPPSFLSIAY
jgi:hypothetical protein